MPIEIELLKDTIKDQSQTISRLQEECTAKTNTILQLGDEIIKYKQKLKQAKEALELYANTVVPDNLQQDGWHFNAQVAKQALSVME